MCLRTDGGAACLVIETNPLYGMERDRVEIQLSTPSYTPFDCSSTTPSDFAAFELSIVR